MTIAKRLTAVFTAIITLISCFTFSASAKNVCDEISGKSDWDGGVSTTFYLKTKNKKNHYIKMDMTKGELYSPDNCLITLQNKNIYDYYEVLVFGKNTNGTYTQLSKNNVKNKSSYKIEFKGYTDYKIKIYSWKTSTINRVDKHCKVLFSSKPAEDAQWYNGHVPTWKICKTSGVTLCR